MTTYVKKMIDKTEDILEYLHTLEESLNKIYKIIEEAQEATYLHSFIRDELLEIKKIIEQI